MPIDVWMQHPTVGHLRHDMFASLRRWTGLEVPAEELPIAATVAASTTARSKRLRVVPWLWEPPPTDRRY